MQARHLYAGGWLLVGAILGVAAAKFTVLLGVAAVACFGLGVAVERGWTAAVRESVANRLPVEVHVSASRKGPRLARPDTPRGFLDFQRDFEHALGRGVRVLAQLNRVLDKGNALANRYTPRIVAAQQASSDVQHRIAREYGEKLGGNANEMETVERRFRQVAGDISGSLLGRLRSAPAVQDLSDFRPLIAQLHDPTTGARASTVEFRQALVGLRRLAVQQAVSAASDRMIEAVDRLIEDYDLIISSSEDALAEIDRRLDQPPTAVSAVATDPSGPR